MAQPSDVNVDDLRRRARRRLVGAIVLALAAAVFVPMLLESEPRPLGEDVSVKIPPVDNNKFVNKLNAKGGDAAKTAPGKLETPKLDAPKSDAPKPDTPKSEAPKSEAPKSEAPKSEADPAAILAGGPTNPPPPAASTMASATPAPDASAAAAPRKSLAEAEQKVLSASGKAPAAAPPPAPAAAPKVAAPMEAPKVEPPKAEPAKAEPAKAETAGTDTPKTESAKAAPVSPGFSVQLAAFTDDKGANSLVNKLTKAGYVAYVEPVTNTKGTLWRVRVGPFPTREAAGASRDKLKGDGYSGIVTASK